jgi:hypothetical protein
VSDESTQRLIAELRLYATKDSQRELLRFKAKDVRVLLAALDESEASREEAWRQTAEAWKQAGVWEDALQAAGSRLLRKLAGMLARDEVESILMECLNDVYEEDE